MGGMSEGVAGERERGMVGFLSRGGGCGLRSV